MKTTKGLIVGLATTLATLLTSSLALANTEVTELEYYSLKGSELSYVYSVPAGCEKHQSKVRVDVRPLESETNGKTQIELFIRIEDRSKSVEACDDGETREVAGKKNIHSLVNKKLKKLGLKRGDVWTHAVYIRPNKNFRNDFNGEVKEWESIRGYNNREYLP